MISKVAKAVSRVQSQPLWFAWVMLLGCEDEASRKSVTSRATAVAPDSFEAEFPDRFRDAGRFEDAGRFGDVEAPDTEPTDPGVTTTNATNADSQTSSSTEEPSVSVTTPGGSAVSADVASTASTITDQTALGPALLAWRLAVELPCGEKVTGDSTLCVNTGCVDGAGIDISDSWTVPGEPPEAYDITIDLVGSVETVAVGEAAESNGEMRAVQSSEVAPGPVNVYQLRVGDNNYVLSASDVSGNLRLADGISLALGAIQGGTSLALRATSTDCQQRSTCTLQNNCTTDPVPGDAQTLEVQVTAISL